MVYSIRVVERRPSWQGGAQALTAVKSKMTDSSALEANVGRMPRYRRTRPTILRIFQLVHTQEPILDQRAPSF